MGTLTAVEPSEGMRTIFDKSVQDERVSCQNGSFENTGITNHSADLVVVAQVQVQSPSYRAIDGENLSTFQAFHWCQDYDAAAAGVCADPKARGYRGVDLESGRPVCLS